MDDHLKNYAVAPYSIIRLNILMRAFSSHPNPKQFQVNIRLGYQLLSLDFNSFPFSRGVLGQNLAWFSVSRAILEVRPT